MSEALWFVAGIAAGVYLHSRSQETVKPAPTTETTGNAPIPGTCRQVNTDTPAPQQVNVVPTVKPPVAAAPELARMASPVRVGGAMRPNGSPGAGTTWQQYQARRASIPNTYNR